MSKLLGVAKGLTPVALLALGLVGACNDGVSGPNNPSLVIQQAVTNTTWDFTGLLNLGAGVHDLGTTETITQSPFGQIDLSTDGSNTHLTSKGQELPVGDTERGLGLCIVNTGCTGDEVGDHGAGVLFMNLNGVLPTGSTLTQIDLGSVQTAEGWKISYSTTGIAGAYSLLSQGEGNGSNNAGDNIVLTGAPLPLATANLVLKFEKNTSASGNLTTDNDYVVKSVTTSSETSEGCTFTIGYWKNHPDAWPTSSLTLGTVVYTKQQLLNILNAPVKGNGLISLAHQLIGAKLNLYPGSNTNTSSADALIGGLVIPPVGSGYLAPSATSSLVNSLTAFNEGNAGTPHCED